MDQSPPKRITRARAAAKSTDDPVKTARVATAASKAAKVTKTTTTKSTTTKRKTRSDEEGDELNSEQNNEQMADETNKPERKINRGRPRKVNVQAEPEKAEIAAPAPARATRGRPKKLAVEPTPSQPARSLRGRAMKDEKENAEEATVVEEEPPKKITRTRAPTLTRATGPKKTVKFEEPDKENIDPPTRGKRKVAEAASGLRAKPVRKPAASATASTRSTRARAKPVQEEKVDKPMPLSPKKATQVNANKGQSSEDELSTTVKTPMKPLSKSPVKPPGSIFDVAKKIDFSASVATNKPMFPSHHDQTASIMMSPARRPPQLMENKPDLAGPFAHKPTLNGTQELTASIMASPARRPPQSSTFKDTLKVSPQKFELGEAMRSPFKRNLFAPEPSERTSPFKASLLQSPARRPTSPMKVNEAGSPTRETAGTSFFNATPKLSTFNISKFATPRTLQKSAIRNSNMLLPTAANNNVFGATPIPKSNEASPAPMVEFTGRLSSILPRSADPTFSPVNPQDATCIERKFEEPTVSDKVEDDVDTIEVQSTTPTCSPPRNNTGSFELREEKTPFDDDSGSEDELASVSKNNPTAAFANFRTNDFASSPATPVRFTTMSKTPKTVATQPSTRAMRKENQNNLGFTPLAKQLSAWMAASPEKATDSEPEISRPTTPTKISTTEEAYADLGSTVVSTAKSTFFEDEMTVREEVEMVEHELPTFDNIEIDEPEFNDVELIEEDLDLAEEADELSMLDPEAFNNDDKDENEDTIFGNVDNEVQVPETTPSEASEEYGDENEVPIDPELLAAIAPPAFSTPKRVFAERTFHTVSKVPLKEAHETPMRPSLMKRSASISKLPVVRPSNLARSNTVLSYSPIKKTPRSQQKSSQKVSSEDTMQEYTTPSKADGITALSTVATPARTPRADLDTALLKGAVVFVDVHTTEGADASGLFTELLFQMGARCVKTWTWNPNTDEDGSKIGITHVVFKDGGKRTLEKVKEAAGVVSCVGVGWVLDCERENKWLDEAPYLVDTTLIPRGGHRRRKSMEPRALANLNGTLVPSTVPAKSTFSNFMDTTKNTPLTQKSKRRESVEWVWSPVPAGRGSEDAAGLIERGGQDEEDEDELAMGDDKWMLSPVPPTPKPEAISAYAEEGLWGSETPGAQTPYFFKRETLLQRTAPGGKEKKFVDLEEEDDEEASKGEGGLSGLGAFGGACEDKDRMKRENQSVLMRLMAARRKSLQWAPKVGSPLARSARGREGSGGL